MHTQREHLAKLGLQLTDIQHLSKEEQLVKTL